MRALVTGGKGFVGHWLVSHLEANGDEVAVIDMGTNAVIATVDTRAPQGMLQDAKNGKYTGAAPIAVTLSPDEKTLYAVNDGANSIAVIPLCRRIDRHLVRWARWKYKRLERSGRRAWVWLAGVRSRNPEMFVHWRYCSAPS